MRNRKAYSAVYQDQDLLSKQLKEIHSLMARIHCIAGMIVDEHG